MKLITTAVLSLILGTAAAADQVVIENFNFNYQSPHGSGTASKFSRETSGMGGAVDVILDKIDRDFFLKVSGETEEEFELKDAPNFMVNSETMNVASLNFNLSQSISISLGVGRFVGESSLGLDGFFLSCGRDMSQAKLMDQLLSACTQNMTLKSAKFHYLSSKKTDLAEILTASILEVVSEEARTKANTDIRSLDLRTSNHKYNFSADIKASQISGKVRSQGSMSYDAASGVLTVRINEVKLSILNITSRVFNELEKLQNEKFPSSKALYLLQLKIEMFMENNFLKI